MLGPCRQIGVIGEDHSPATGGDDLVSVEAQSAQPAKVPMCWSPTQLPRDSAASSKALLRAHIGAVFSGWLMSDGYGAYRHYPHRLRCWTHLMRKARALAETYNPHAQGYGNDPLNAFDRLIEAVRQARNDKARRLGVELLNNWDALSRPGPAAPAASVMPPSGASFTRSSLHGIKASTPLLCHPVQHMHEGG